MILSKPNALFDISLTCCLTSSVDSMWYCKLSFSFITHFKLLDSKCPNTLFFVVVNHANRMKDAFSIILYSSIMCMCVWLFPSLSKWCFIVINSFFSVWESWLEPFWETSGSLFRESRQGAAREYSEQDVLVRQNSYHKTLCEIWIWREYKTFWVFTSSGWGDSIYSEQAHQGFPCHERLGNLRWITNIGKHSAIPKWYLDLKYGLMSHISSLMSQSHIPQWFITFLNQNSQSWWKLTDVGHCFVVWIKLLHWCIFLSFWQLGYCQMLSTKLCLAGCTFIAVTG